MTDGGSPPGTHDDAGAGTPPAGPPRPALGAMPTREVELHPQFVDALKAVAPKRRPSWTARALVLALVAGVTGVAATPSLRQRVLLAMGHAQPEATAATAATASVPPDVAPPVPAPSSSAPTAPAPSASSSPPPASVAPAVSAPAPAATASSRRKPPRRISH